MIRKYPQKIEDLFDQIAPWSEYDKAKLEWKLKADAPSEIVEAREKLNRALEEMIFAERGYDEDTPVNPETVKKHKPVKVLDRWDIARRIYWIVGYIPMAVVMTVLSGSLLLALLLWLPFIAGLDFLIFKMMRWDHEWDKLIKKWEDDVREYNLK